MSPKLLLLPVLSAVLLAACGKPESTPAATSSPATPAPAAQVSTQGPAVDSSTATAATDNAAVGEAIFKKTCSLCHATGAGGSPLLTDSADWAPRKAKGTELLYQHAIEGFTGDKGMMPPKGANMALSDDEVKATVDYMLSQVK